MPLPLMLTEFPGPSNQILGLMRVPFQPTILMGRCGEARCISALSYTSYFFNQPIWSIVWLMMIPKNRWNSIAVCKLFPLYCHIGSCWKRLLRDPVFAPHGSSFGSAGCFYPWTSTHTETETTYIRSLRKHTSGASWEFHRHKQRRGTGESHL